MALEVWTVSSVLPGTDLIVLLPTARTLQHVHQKGAYTVSIFLCNLCILVTHMLKESKWTLICVKPAYNQG